LGVASADTGRCNDAGDLTKVCMVFSELAAEPRLNQKGCEERMVFVDNRAIVEPARPRIEVIARYLSTVRVVNSILES
jgi:hypothetical protein